MKSKSNLCYQIETIFFFERPPLKDLQAFVHVEAAGLAESTFSALEIFMYYFVEKQVGLPGSIVHCTVNLNLVSIKYKNTYWT
jgi:hypothetical protein